MLIKDKSPEDTFEADRERVFADASNRGVDVDGLRRNGLGGAKFVLRGSKAKPFMLVPRLPWRRQAKIQVGHWRVARDGSLVEVRP